MKPRLDQTVGPLPRTGNENPGDGVGRPVAQVRKRRFWPFGALLAASAVLLGAVTMVSVPEAFAAAPALQIDGSLPGGVVSVAYNASLTVTGGNAPYKWSVSSGALPAGLTLNKSSGAVSGTPMTAGSSTFTVHVVGHRSPTEPHARGTATVSMALDVSPDVPPAVDAFTASPSSLPVTGGSVSLMATVTNATNCTFSVSPAVAGSPSAVPCGSGSASTQFTIPANSASTPLTYSYSLNAVGPAASTTSDPPESTTVAAAPATISADIQTTTAVGIFSSPTSSSSELATMPAGTSPGFICWTTGPVVVYVNVWFRVFWNGIAGYYASYYDNSSYPTDFDITSEYGIPMCPGTGPGIQTTTATTIYSSPTTASSALGVMPSGTSPTYNCWTTGPVVGYVNVWFSISWNGISGYYASYYDNSRYPTDSDITALYGIQPCAGPPPQPTETQAEINAVNWAIGQIGSTNWPGLCLSFAQAAWNDGAGVNLESLTSGVQYNSNTDPQDVWGHFTSGTTGTGTPPPGSLVFFNATSGHDPEDYSHVTIMGNNGEMISTPDTFSDGSVHYETLAQHEASGAWNTYVGWWLPDGS